MPDNVHPTAFTTPEATMVEKFEVAQRNLANRADISSRDQVAIRRILLASQCALATLQRAHIRSTLFQNFHRNVAEYERLVNEIVGTMLQNTNMLRDHTAQVTEASIVELLQGLSQEALLQFYLNTETLGIQMHRAMPLSNDIVRVLETFDEQSENPASLKRFEAIRDIICKAINDINDVIEGPQDNAIPAPENDATRQATQDANTISESASDSSHSASDSESESNEEEEFDDFGIYAVFHEMEKQLDATVKRYEIAWNTLTNLSKAICRLLHKEPSDATSESDSTSSASSSSNGFFSPSRSRSPSPGNPDRAAGPGV